MRRPDDRVVLVGQGVLTNREYDVRHAPVRELTAAELIEAVALGTIDRRQLVAEHRRRRSPYRA